MSKIILSSVLVVCLLVDKAFSIPYYPIPWPSQQQTQTCITGGGACEQFNILLQCCPGLVCAETVIPGVKTVFTEFRCKPDIYNPYGQGQGPYIGGGIRQNEDEQPYQ